jgi:hypothetical protein
VVRRHNSARYNFKLGVVTIQKSSWTTALTLQTQGHGAVGLAKPQHSGGWANFYPDNLGTVASRGPVVHPSKPRRTSWPARRPRTKSVE